MNCNTLKTSARNARRRPAVVLLTLLCWMNWACLPSALAQESPTPEPLATEAPGCRTDLARRWLCPGDRAPSAGHLVPAQTLIDCAAARQQAALVPGLRLGLSQVLQREEAWLEREQLLIDQVGQRDVRILELERAEAVLGDRLEASPGWSQVWLWSLLVAGGALLVGGGVGFVVGVTR